MLGEARTPVDCDIPECLSSSVAHCALSLAVSVDDVLVFCISFSRQMECAVNCLLCQEQPVHCANFVVQLMSVHVRLS